MALGETISVISGAMTPFLIAAITWFGNNSFKSVKRTIKEVDDWNRREHGVISEQIRELSSNYSAERKIVKIATEAEQFVDKDDKEMMVFIKACVDVSIHFYNQLSAKGLRFCTEEDIERASNGAIEFVDNAKNAFDVSFTELFWEEFIDNAVDIRSEFLEIFEDEFNRKEERFVISIERYLFNQLKMVIKKRNKWEK